MAEDRRSTCPYKDLLTDLKSTVFGNGKNGLNIEVHDLKQYVAAQEERRRNRSQKNWAIYLLVISNMAFFARDVIGDIVKWLIS